MPIICKSLRKTWNNNLWISFPIMGRLLSIEYFKLRNSKYFWVLLILFLIFLLSVPIGTKIFLDYMTSIGEEFLKPGIRADELPVFDFVDIWQNLTWVYKSFSIFLGFIIVISVSNEFAHRTIRQHVIDGLSRTEFLLSKVIFILVISAAVSLIVLCIGLIMGFLWSPVKEFTFVVKNIEFIGAYFFHLVAFQLLCLVIALLIKRSGITIALLIFYVYTIEPIITGIISYHYKLPAIADLFPISAIGNIIRIPFSKYILRETQTFISLPDAGVLFAYIILLSLLAYRLVVKRDL